MRSVAIRTRLALLVMAVALAVAGDPSAGAIAQEERPVLLLERAAVPKARRILPVVQAVPVPVEADGGGVAVIRRGLAGTMRRAGEALGTLGRRHEATRALDEALHLAELAANLRAAPPAGAEGFGPAHRAVLEARHALQMGRPEEAAHILLGAAEALLAGVGAEAVPEPAPERTRPTPEEIGRLLGSPVLNAEGAALGEVQGFAEGPDGEMYLVVSSGGFLDIGDTDALLPLRDALLGRHRVAMPTAEGPEGLRQAIAAAPKVPVRIIAEEAWP